MKHIDSNAICPSDQYYAGFLDGEGCFRFNRARNHCWGGTPCVSVSNTYLPVLRMLQTRWGGNVRLAEAATAKSRTCYKWECFGKNARNCLRAVLPYLVEKQEQAQLLLAMVDVHPMYREDYIERMRDLKHIDYATHE